MIQVQAEIDQVGREIESQLQGISINKNRIDEAQTLIRDMRLAVEAGNYAPELLSIPCINQIYERLSSLKRERGVMKNRYGTRHFVMQNLDTEIEDTEQLLKTRVIELRRDYKMIWN